MNATAKTVATYAAAGMKDTEIAAKMGFNRQTVFDIRRHYGIPSPVTQASERKRAQIAHLHGCGLTDEEIALTSGMSWESVRYIRRRMGLDPNKALVPRSLPPRVRRERQKKASMESKRRKRAERAENPASKPAPKPKPVAAAPAPKPKLHDQIRPIRAALGGVFDREPSADVQGAVAVAMSRLHTDPAFARAWMEAGR